METKTNPKTQVLTRIPADCQIACKVLAAQRRVTLAEVVEAVVRAGLKQVQRANGRTK